MSKDIQEFIADFNAEVMDRAGGADGTGADFKENVFTELVLEYLADLGIVENAATVYFDGRVGRGNAKINGYAIRDDEDSLDLFVSIFMNTSQTVRIPAEEIKKAIEQSVRYFDGALKGLHETMEPATEVYGMTSRIHDLSQRISRVRVFVLSDGITGIGRGVIPDRVIGAVQLKFEIWDIERLSRVLESGKPQQEIDINLDETYGEPVICVKLPEIVTEYQAYVAILPSELLYRLYDEYGAQLMERNVRSFLQAKGKVNKGIRDTLRNEPGRFMAYNNGISITADTVETRRLDDGQLVIKRIKGLQIVNGGQTTASVHRAKKVDKVDLSLAFVQAKITVVREDLLDALAPKIAEFANTQNPIQMADFSANDPFHIAIERLSKSIWIPGEQGKWFYERARGQYSVAQVNEGHTAAQLKRFKDRTPPSRKFTKTDLAKYLNTWDQLPHDVSEGGQKNFVLFAQRLREVRTKTWQPDEGFYKELISKAILFNETAVIVRKEKFAAYRPNITAYTVAYLAHRSAGQLDLMHIWEHQRLSVSLEELLKNWCHRIADEIVSSAQGRNVTEWAKKPDCWKAIRVLDLPLPDPLPPEFQKTVAEGGRWGVKPTETRVPLDPDEIDALTLCRRTDATDWVRIVEWGRNSGLLDPEQRQVATHLATLAANGWMREPTARQAKEGRRIVNMALERSVLEAGVARA